MGFLRTSRTRARPARRIALLAAIIGTACGTCGGCATPASSFYFTDEGLAEGARSWRRQAPPATQATIDTLVVDGTVLIHFVRGNLTGQPSRGSLSLPASSLRAKVYCLLHPAVKGIKPERNWDVVYDPKMAEAEAQRLGVVNPLEALLHHEVIGHILPVLQDPGLVKRIGESLRLRDENERSAVQRENEYRRHVGLPLVPEEFTWLASS